ncbi:hypothetical protein QZH41_014419, partial [Actinostola sp. cb2023]
DIGRDIQIHRVSAETVCRQRSVCRQRHRVSIGHPSETPCVGRDTVCRQRHRVSAETPCVGRDTVCRQRHRVSAETPCVGRDTVCRQRHRVSAETPCGRDTVSAETPCVGRDTVCRQPCVGRDTVCVGSRVSAAVCRQPCVGSRVSAAVCRSTPCVGRVSAAVCRQPPCVGSRVSAETPCVGRRVSAAVCRQPCVGSRVSAAVCRQPCVGSRVSAAVCRQPCVGSRVSAAVCRQPCVGSRVSAAVCRQPCVGSRVSAEPCVGRDAVCRQRHFHTGGERIAPCAGRLYLIRMPLHVAALEHLVDVSREKACNDASRYAIILRQTRSLLASPSLQPLLLKLLGAQEVAISKEIQKALKSCAPPWIPRLQDARSQAAPYWRGQQRGGPTCYNCMQLCPRKYWWPVLQRRAVASKL